MVNSQIIISQNEEQRLVYFQQLLEKFDLKNPHPDVLYIEDEKLGVESTKQIREFLKLKPYQSDTRVVFILNAHNFTQDAQNSLLKTLEEPPQSTLIVLGGNTADAFLPTVKSRCQIITLDKKAQPIEDKLDEIKNLLAMDTQERFKYIEKLEEKDQFLDILISYFRTKFLNNPSLLPTMKIFQQASEWKEANGNIRAILEYLMLKLPQA